MKRILFAISMGAAMCPGALALTLESVPGSLQAITAAEVTDGTLVVTGTVDARDIAAIGALPASVEKIDLSRASIAEFSGPAVSLHGRTFFGADEIPEYSFFRSEARTVLLPASVKRIGEGAFSNSAITEITLPEGVTNAGDYAFFGCRALSSVSLPSSLARIGTGCFGNCTALTSFDLSATSVTAIPDRAFAGCTALTSVATGSGIRSLGREVFEKTAIRSIDLRSVTELGDYSLAGMPALTDVALARSADAGRGVLMDNARLQTVTSSPSSIPALFAANCTALEPVAILPGATSVGEFAFASTPAGSLTFGPGLLEIDSGAFASAGSITLIDATALGEAVPGVRHDSFTGMNPNDVTILVARQAEGLWRSHPVWGEFSIVAAGAGGTAAGEADSPLRIDMSGGFLLVDAGSSLKYVAVHTPDGAEAARWLPASDSVRIPIDEIPSGVVIVIASTGEATASMKLMVR